ncbi:MAG TPA: Mce protein [Mycobacterium sp.]
MAVDDDAPDPELSEASVPTSEKTPDGDDDSDLIAEEPSEQPANADDGRQDASPPEPRVSRLRVAAGTGLVIALALVGLNGWLGFRAYQSHQAENQRQLFLQVGRQGALNLTTIDYQHAEADVQRILDSATGGFHDDFSKRSQPFIEVIKKAQAASIGTITAAGLESDTHDEAQVLVAVSVKTANAGAAEQTPRAWRMRISVTKVGDQAKVSSVVFVP